MKTRRGFTFVELLVVICIIALLAGLFMPVIARIREMANQRRAQQNGMVVEQPMPIKQAADYLPKPSEAVQGQGYIIEYYFDQGVARVFLIGDPEQYKDSGRTFQSYRTPAFLAVLEIRKKYFITSGIPVTDRFYDSGITKELILFISPSIVTNSSNLDR